MSHFTTIKTKIKDRDYLKKALEDMGYPYKEGSLKITGFGGKEKQVELAIYPEEGYPIGFRQKANEYEVVADWWGVKVDRNKLISNLTQRYAYHTVVQEAQNQGFNIVSEEKEKDGSLRVVVQRWR